MNLKNINLDNVQHLDTEESTKTALIMPFLMELGYNVFNPQEVIPEFTADIAKRNGEKVDFAIKINEKVSIIIEAKKVTENLSNHSKQLARYYVNTEAKIAILTNGLEYWFYTDLDKVNIMDAEPFFKINLTSITEAEIIQLQDFTKDKFDETRLYGHAEKSRKQKRIATTIVNQFRNPDDEFVKIIMKDIQENTDNEEIVNNYKELIVKSYDDIMNKEMLTRMFPNQQLDIDLDIINKEKCKREVLTTENELAIYHYIQTLFKMNDYIDIDKLSWRDNASYFNIVYDNKITKWIIRVYDKKDLKIVIHNENEDITIVLNHPIDILDYEDNIIQAINSRQNISK